MDSIYILHIVYYFGYSIYATNLCSIGYANKPIGSSQFDLLSNNMHEFHMSLAMIAKQSPFKLFEGTPSGQTGEMFRINICIQDVHQLYNRSCCMYASDGTIVNNNLYTIIVYKWLLTMVNIQQLLLTTVVIWVCLFISSPFFSWYENRYFPPFY